MKRMKVQFGTIDRKERKKGPDVWVLRFFREKDNKRVYASEIIGTLDEYPTIAQAAAAAESARIGINGGKPCVRPTMGGLIDRYITDKLPDRYATRKGYLSCLTVHVKPKWGACTLEELGKSAFEVEKWFEGLDLAPKTKGNIKALMNRLFECAMKWGLYPIVRNPMELVEIKGRTKRQRRRRVLTYEEFSHLLGFLRQPYRTMVLVAQCLGLRVSEVMALKWSDFDFERLTLRVERGIVGGRVDDVKSEYSEDDLPLDPDFAAVMLEWQRQCPKVEEGWIFANPDTSKPYWPDAACQDHIRPAGKAAGLGDDIGWHTFRHTYRAWLDECDAPISMQRELMRHASIQTTMDVYGRSSRVSEAKRAMNSKVVKMALKPAPDAGKAKANGSGGNHLKVAQ